MNEKMTHFYNELKKVVSNSTIKTDELMSRHTTFKTGGPADIFIIPDSIQSIISVIGKCIEHKVDYYVIGRGSNLLVGDKGYRGVIICINNCLDDIEFIESDEKRAVVRAGAGVMLGKLAMTVAREGCKGFEFASGIPGNLGGAVAMNAGAYGGEIKDCIVRAKVIDDKMQIKILNNEELELGYRSSVVKNNNYIVLETEFIFEKDDSDEIMRTIEDFNSRRRDKQPLEYPSAGSTFKRPQGYFAGKLIQDSELAGYRVGGACVSQKHCGFVINDKEGTSSDVLAVISDVQRIVKEKFDVELEPEVRIIGEF